MCIIINTEQKTLHLPTPTVFIRFSITTRGTPGNESNEFSGVAPKTHGSSLHTSLRSGAHTRGSQYTHKFYMDVWIHV